VAVVLLQLGVGAAMVLFALPRPLQAAHVAAGAGVWAVLVWVALGWRPVVSSLRSDDRNQ
jgi:heme A synthase